MTASSLGSNRIRIGSLLPGVVVLIVAGIITLWAVHYFSAEARVRRATVRLIEAVEKTGEESPIVLGLAANRLGKSLATHMVLSLDEVGLRTSGRQETVQLFAQIRQSVDVMTFDNPQLMIEKSGKDRVNAHVIAQVRLVGASAEAYTGKGEAALEWVKGKDGWQIVRAVLQAAEGTKLPKGWE